MKPTELFYRSGPAIVAATLAPSPSMTVLRRDTLLSTNATLNVVSATYDVMPNGHFVLAQSIGTTAPPVIVFGWVDEVKERVEAATKR